MFAKIAEFFIKNWKLTFVLVLITLIAWVWAYFVLPKQYNPTIVVPAFNVMVPAPSLEAWEIKKLVVEPLEDKLMELEWIDDVYWLSWENFWAVMVKFKVWTDKEKAKIRLIQKIRENMDLKPLSVKEPIIKTIDPDELPQITFAISYKDWNEKEKISEEEKYIYLRQIANIIKKDIRTIENVTTMDIVWGFHKNIVVELDIEKIEAKNVDIMWIYKTLEENNLSLPSWDINSKSWEKTFVSVEWKFSNIENLKKLVVWDFNWKIVYLEDVAKIKYWINRINKTSTYTDNKDKKTKETVFLWVWKAIWTNAVFVTKDVIKKVEEIKKKLPKNIEVNIIQNEWKTAEEATNMLLINLVQSVIIVFLVLAFYLWAKDAFNTSVSIPLTLWMVFLIAYIFWENINKITLFALILVLWMLVDNSTVVVENISRHLKERKHTWKRKLKAVLEWTQEVWAWVILATVTRLLAFGSMFAVTWMMWEYMGPIPQFAIRALLVSLAIAFTINPWISYLWAKELEEEDTKKKEKSDESPLKIRRKYVAFMKFFLDDSKTWKFKRILFKLVFWFGLFAIILWPIYAWIFKARMLPKSNQNQIYLWIDAPKDWWIEKMKKLEKDVNKILLNPNLVLEDKKEKNKDLVKKQKIDTSLDWVVKSVSITMGQPFMWDFANLFRWWLNRFWENELSARINLVSPSKYEEKYKKTRLSSEEFTIRLRPKLKEYLLSRYPDIKIRLLEDPPGPPVRATFLIKIKSDANPENVDKFREIVEKEVKKIAPKQKVVDVLNSKNNPKRKVTIKIDNESLSLAWLTTQQVAYTLWIALNWVPINLVKNKDSLEATNIILTSLEKQNTNLNILKKITFTNPSGQKIPLESIATLKYEFVSNEIYTDKREEAQYIYWEMWDNSLIYPVIELFWKFMDDSFWATKKLVKNDKTKKEETVLEKNYKLVSWSPYELNYIWLKDWKKYKIEWWWEWELTMDTFRDLWIAMWLSLLAIYFLLVWQFASFRIAWVIMITFLLWFFWVFPGFTVLYLLKNEYFSATSMIWVIALAWIVVWNAIILIDYLNVLKKNWLTIKNALLKAGYVRFAPIILTSLTTVFWAATIIWDPVWSGLAWTIIWWLFISSILTLVVIPIFYYDSQKANWEKDIKKV